MIWLENLMYRLRNLVAPTPVRPLEDCARVQPEDIERVYSERLAEDGRMCRLYDLRCGRVAAQAYPPGANPRDLDAYPIAVCD